MSLVVSIDLFCSQIARFSTMEYKGPKNLDVYKFLHLTQC